MVANSAKEKAPVDTGELRDSITYRVEDNSVIIGTSCPYAPYQELGTGLFAYHGDGRQTPWRYQDRYGEWHTTSGNHPHPFLEPALFENEQAIVRILKPALKQVILEGLEYHERYK